MTATGNIHSSSGRGSDSLAQPRRGLSFELIVVMAVGVVPLVFDSTWMAIYTTRSVFNVHEYTHSVLSRSLDSLGVLLLIAYLIFRRGESVRDFGFRFRLSLIPASVAVFVLGLAVFSAVYNAMRHLYGIVPELANGRMDSGIPSEIPAAVVMLKIATSAFFEELVVRAYLMTRLRALGWRPCWVVIASATVQASYHTYQGFAVALACFAMFVVFAGYFDRYRNVLALILAHIYANLVWWAIS